MGAVHQMHECFVWQRIDQMYPLNAGEEPEYLLPHVRIVMHRNYHLDVRVLIDDAAKGLQYVSYRRAEAFSPMYRHADYTVMLVRDFREDRIGERETALRDAL